MDIMNRIIIILSLVLSASIVLNVLLIFYSRNITRRLVVIADEIGDLRTAATAFSQHVKDVYKLEMFYGDQTLQALMDHARSFKEYMDTFDYVYLLNQQDEGEDVENNTEEEG